MRMDRALWVDQMANLDGLGGLELRMEAVGSNCILCA
jgi:hypothetical protein